MPMNREQARQFLAKGEIGKLFIEEMGWDHHTGKLTVTIGDSTLTLESLAQKRGMVAY